MGIVVPNPVCNENRTCFAKEDGKCTILLKNYPKGKCPFRKTPREYKRGLEKYGWGTKK